MSLTTPPPPPTPLVDKYIHCDKHEVNNTTSFLHCKAKCVWERTFGIRRLFESNEIKTWCKSVSSTKRNSLISLVVSPFVV